jgi:hypothetical protein
MLYQRYSEGAQTFIWPYLKQGKTRSGTQADPLLKCSQRFNGFAISMTDKASSIGKHKCSGQS